MATTILRHPAVAGRFYPGDPDDLRAEARGSGTSRRMHCSPRGIHVFRACCGRGICAGGNTETLHRIVSEPHRHGSRAGHYE